MGEGEGSYVWSSSDQDLGAPKKSLKKGPHHRKRESRHHVIDCGALRNPQKGRKRLRGKKAGTRPKRKNATRPLFPPELKTIRIAGPFGRIGRAMGR